MKEEKCLFCDLPVEVKEINPLSEYSFNCKNCGKYRLSHIIWKDRDHDTMQLIKRTRQNISGYLRECTEKNITLPMIKTENLIEFYENSFIPISIEDKINKYLLFILRKTEYFGCVIKQTVLCNHPAICYAHNLEELHEICSYLKDRNYIEYHPETDNHGYKLTFLGMEKANSLMTREDSKQGFIAMWFDDQMRNARKSICDAIEATGFKVMIIDKKPHIDYIPDQIIAEIRKSLFLVADLTENNNGVYYEAGFARGLNIPVIYTCKKSFFDTGKVHFDVKQINCIRWDNETDLYEALKYSIEANIKHIFK